MGGRGFNYTQTSKVKSLCGSTGHQSKAAFVWKIEDEKCWSIGASVAPQALPTSLIIPGDHSWSQCGTSEAGTTSAAFADAQSLVRAGVSSKSPWGFARVEGLVELCVHWVLLDFCKKWQMQASAGTPKCCLPREHLGLSLESRFAEELSTSGCWKQGWGWRGEVISYTGVKNCIFWFIFRRPFWHAHLRNASS